MKMPLGRLIAIDPHEYWKHEAHEFTPWLAEPENIALLAETLDMELEVQSVEEPVGPFRADILCKALGEDRIVLIENQLAKTDHIHLGQILTYASGLNAVDIIWIARSFTDEHRAALDWLNRITNESANFFGLEIELWQIGESDLAPKFNIVCQPNNWSKSITPDPRITDTQQLQLEYWGAYAEFLREKGIKTPKPQRQNWMDLSIGRSGFILCTSISTTNLATLSSGDREIRMELVINNTDAKGYYTLLKADRDAIERELGESLIWHNPEGSKQCRIAHIKPANFTDRDDWPNQFAWLYEHLVKFKKIFSPRVKALTL